MNSSSLFLEICPDEDKNLWPKVFTVVLFKIGKTIKSPKCHRIGKCKFEPYDEIFLSDLGKSLIDKKILWYYQVKKQCTVGFNYEDAMK